MVPGVEAHDRTLAQRDAVRVRGPPVGDVGRVEGRLEQLVLEHEALVVAETRVHLPQRVGESVLAVAQIALPGVVETVGQPDLEVAAADDVHDVDALAHVRDRLGAHPRVVMTETSELVVVVLEGVGVDRAEPHPEVVGVAAQLVEVVDAVPRDVQRHRRRPPGERVDLGGVGDLLVGVARHARRGEDLEARPGVAERPRRQLDRLAVELGRDVREGCHQWAPPLDRGDGVMFNRVKFRSISHGGQGSGT